MADENSDDNGEMRNTFDQDPSSEESDDEANLDPDDPEFEYDFLRTLGALHSKDSNVLDKSKKPFFKETYESKKKEKSDKPLTLKEYDYQMLFKGSDETENNEPLEEEIESSQNRKVSFKDDSDSDDQDDNDLLASGLFKKTENASTSSETAKNPAQTSKALEFVKGNVDSLENKKDENMLNALKNAWTDPKLSNKDKWLVDYFVNKKFLDDEDESIEREKNHVIIDEETISDDEKLLSKMEDFEAKYRFRYEEPDKEFIKTFPRIMNDAVRSKKKSKRKEKREKLKMKKVEDKNEIISSVNKASKDKLQKIKSISGKESLNIEPSMLDEDFDDEAHDRLMKKMFNDDYYDVSENLDDLKQPVEGIDGDDADDESNGTAFKFQYKKVIPNSFGLDTETILTADDGELNKWCAINKMMKYDRSGETEKADMDKYTKKLSSKKAKTLYPTIFKTKLTPKEKKTLLNQKKKLRKKNKQEEPGKLNIADIKLDSTNENQLESNEKEDDVVEETSAFTDEITNEVESNLKEESALTDENKNAKSPKKNKNRKRKNKSNEETPDESNEKNNLSKSKKPKKNLPFGGFSHKTKELAELTDSRLLAYGQNPKKVKNKLKYQN